MVEVYGMTETASVHTIAYTDRPDPAGLGGLPLPYSRVRVVKLDAEGRYRARLRGGRDRRRASWPAPACSAAISTTRITRAPSSTGWVNSGDLGRLDADGYLWITGRAKDLVIRGGHNIDPAPIEEIMFQHPAVGFAAVVGQPDAYAGELPVGYVQLKPGAKCRARRAGSLGARAHAGARRRAGADHPDRSDAADRRRQGVQAAAALGCGAARLHRRPDARCASAASTARSRSARMAATAASQP